MATARGWKAPTLPPISRLEADCARSIQPSTNQPEFVLHAYVSAFPACYYGMQRLGNQWEPFGQCPHRDGAAYHQLQCGIWLAANTDRVSRAAF